MKIQTIAYKWRLRIYATSKTTTWRWCWNWFDRLAFCFSSGTYFIYLNRFLTNNRYLPVVKIHHMCWIPRLTIMKFLKQYWGERPRGKWRLVVALKGVNRELAKMTKFKLGACLILIIFSIRIFDSLNGILFLRMK